MNLRGITAIFLFLAFALIAETAPQADTNQPPAPEYVTEGKELYLTHCVECHNEDGVGEEVPPWGIRHPKFVPGMPLNETSHAWHHTDEQLRTAILNGVPSQQRMPAFRNRLSPKQAMYIVHYIKSLWSQRILACQGPKRNNCMR